LLVSNYKTEFNQVKLLHDCNSKNLKTRNQVLPSNGYRLGSWSTRLGVQRFFNWPMWEAVWTLPRLKRLKIRFICLVRFITAFSWML